LLCAEGNGSVVVNRDAIGAWEEFGIELHHGKIAFRTAHNTYLCAESNHRLVSNRTAVGAWEKFTVETL
jgi:hypothetical protein